jgi:Mn-containing catalase
MAYLSQFPNAESLLDAAPAESRGARRLADRISSMAKRISDYIEDIADYYAAATVYEQLSRLSDAELHRRCLSRADLAREVLAPDTFRHAQVEN